MSFTYVIGDIHGLDDLLGAALGEINARARGAAAVIIALGDYVDKGPQSRQVIERLLPGIGGGWKFIALKGNHDAMMVEALRDPSKLAAWLEKGGDAALASYGGDPAAVPQAHIG
jgi:predicted phosphodiesterase